VMRVDAHHRVLPGIEVRPAVEHAGRDLVLFRRAAFERALDQELEEPRVRARAAERTARENLRGLISDLVVLLGCVWIRSFGHLSGKRFRADINLADLRHFINAAATSASAYCTSRPVRTSPTRGAACAGSIS